MALYVIPCLILIANLSLVKCNILISEVNPNSFGTNNDADFVELVNTESNSVNLDGFYVVFYNGATDVPEAYEVVTLSGRCIDGYGAFLVGSNQVMPAPDIIVPEIQNGKTDSADAVVLYSSTDIGKLNGLIQINLESTIFLCDITFVKFLYSFFSV